MRFNKKIFLTISLISIITSAIFLINPVISISSKKPGEIQQTNLLISNHNENVTNAFNLDKYNVKELNLSQNGINRSIIDFYINNNNDRQRLTSEIQGWLNSILGIVVKQNDINKIEPNFSGNFINVDLNYNQQPLTLKIVGLLPNSKIKTTNVKQRYSSIYKTNRIIINIEKPNWVIDNPSTWKDNDINNPYQYIADKICNSLPLNTKDFIWDGVTYYNLENLSILENVESLYDKKIPLKINQCTPNNNERNLLLLKNQISYSINYVKKINMTNKGFLDLTFYLNNYIIENPIGSKHKELIKFNPNDVLTSQTPAEEMQNIRLDIRLTGFYIQSELLEIQSSFSNKQNEYVIIGFSTGIGTLLLIFIIFMIFNALKPKKNKNK